jgi:cyclophilin family peptidyl-prolyl cis-trans isomerase
MSGRGRAAAAAAAAVLLAAMFYVGIAPRLAAQGGAAPVVVVETSQGTFAIEMYPKEAPISVAHIVGLVKSGFYDGQRVHRALPRFVVQFGDPQTRDPEKQQWWGRGVEASSGTPIGVGEVSLKRKNVAMAVGLAHAGEPAKADSQLYVMLEDKPELDGQYAVIGHVIEGFDVPARLAVGDVIKRVYVRE